MRALSLAPPVLPAASGALRAPSWPRPVLWGPAHRSPPPLELARPLAVCPGGQPPRRLASPQRYVQSPAHPRPAVAGAGARVAEEEQWGGRLSRPPPPLSGFKGGDASPFPPEPQAHLPTCRSRAGGADSSSPLEPSGLPGPQRPPPWTRLSAREGGSARDGARSLRVLLPFGEERGAALLQVDLGAGGDAISNRERQAARMRCR